MAFEPKKYNELVESMRSRSTVLTDFEEGSVTRTLMEAFAFEMGGIYQKMKLVYLSAFIDTAEGIQLDNLVALLGIKRGAPDYTEAEVTFIRDTGSEDILIPVETLVATEDSPENPKKTYKTIREGILGKNETEITLKVQAINRGPEQVTGAESITVMPRPITGIKEVINRMAARFQGKDRETDEELKDRAEKALLAASGANITSVENSLWSLPGIKDVKVVEPFRFAKGKIKIERTGLDPFRIPPGTILRANPLTGPVLYRTMEESRWENDGQQNVIEIESLTEGVEGEIGENPHQIPWSFEENGLNSDISIVLLADESPTPILREAFGIIDVIVDSEKAEEEESFREEIKAVIAGSRAAGILDRLKLVKKKPLDGIFQIELDSGLNPTIDDRLAIERQVAAAIIFFVDKMKMGQDLVFSKLTNEILSIDGVNNMDDFRIKTFLEEDSSIEWGFQHADKRIRIRYDGRFAPQNICVASEGKDLVVNLVFKVSAAMDPNPLELLFEGKKVGESLTQNEITSAYTAIIPGTLKIKPIPWCPHKVLKTDVSGQAFVDTSFVERVVPGYYFIYENDLEVTGAVKLKLPAFMSDADKEQSAAEVRQLLYEYLDNLEPDIDIEWETLKKVGRQVSGVLDVIVDQEDFIVKHETTGWDNTRVSDEGIRVDALERAWFENLCVTGDIEEFILQALSIEVQAPSASISEVQSLRTGLKDVFNLFFDNATTGSQQDISYELLRDQLIAVIQGVNIAFTLSQLNIKGVSSCDGWEQYRSLSNTDSFHVRSVEYPKIQVITEADVIVIT